MNQKRLIESGVLALCIAGLYFLGEAFKAISPVKYYLSPVGINQILTWSSLRFLLLATCLFCLVQFGLHTNRHLVRRLCWSVTASIVLVCFTFGLINIADIRPETLFKGAKEGKIYLSVFATLVIVLFFFQQKDHTHSRIVNSVKAISGVFFLLFVFRVYTFDIPLATPYPEQVARELMFVDQEEMAQRRKVVFIVFDEFDPAVAFSKKEDTNPLENFSKLIDSSFYARNALPPAKLTVESIPAMMLGKETQGNSYDQRFNLYVKTGPNEKIEFNQKNSLFGKVPGGPSAMSILGFYHPYCKIYQAADCVSFPRSKFSNPESWRFWDSLGDNEYITKMQLEHLPSFVSLKSRQLIYLHLNIPHLGASYAAKTFHVPEPSTPNERYSLNLALSDQVLGSIMDTLKRSTAKDEEVLMIVCSDHWFRAHSPARDESKGLPALMVVKLLSDDKGIRFDKTVSTHHLTTLAIDFLNGEIKTHADIANWFLEKPVYKTHLGDKS
jgi:hypothetical protein